MYWRLGTLLIGLLAVPLAGQVSPIPGSGDPRLQTIVYDPEQVVQLPVASGYQLMVSFATGERIETIAVGDSTSWQITANRRGDYLFIKNIVPAPATNMTIVTDARVYNFELMLSSATEGETPFTVRFVYPDPPPPAEPLLETPVRYKYRIGGARQIRPTSIVQDGGRLFLNWPETSPLPAMYRIDDDGAESLVNSEMQDGYFVIEGTPKKLIFRLDSLTANASRSRIRGKR
ncbi:TrbG/VirB9 family P-type conjugative transfer protein [Rhizorhapis suberifaciens]|uniref:Type IV secretion system protein VirB9 n=1 Tax=Rhizorhapis suberifaciens TaxID=13656 RepID=A0A840HW94_9SPHN|nr:TrbG/VirB9 family P-type conjugative transfer protein [Rhizorhapis suberifaciens]MBB4642582.1 type IV secretion system protein VirB9 [Rhizorhapis suberifaciens]